MWYVFWIPSSLLCENFFQPYYNTFWIFQCLRKVAKFIVEQNERVYAPRGLLITDPTERGLRVVSLLLFSNFSSVVSSLDVCSHMNQVF
jgi:hypothetical protein